MSVELTLWKWNTHKVGMCAAVLITYLDMQLQLFIIQHSATVMYASATVDPRFCSVGISTNYICSMARKGFSSIYNNASDWILVLFAWLIAFNGTRDMW